MSPDSSESRKKEKVALFGGTFDPVHYGHLQLAEWIKDKLQLDRVIFIPVRIHPFHKRQDIASPEHRLAMLQRAVSVYKNFEVNPIELEREDVSYTVDTLRTLQKTYPAAELYFLIGDDNLADFHKWKEPDEIRRLAKIVVFRRDGIHKDVKRRYPDFIHLDNPLINISSSRIREYLYSGKKVDDFIPPLIYEYIMQHGLYGAGADKNQGNFSRK